MIAKSWVVSEEVSVLVGSSMMISFASPDSALRISTSCRCAMLSVSIGLFAFSGKPVLVDQRLRVRVHLLVVDQADPGSSGSRVR